MEQKNITIFDPASKEWEDAPWDARTDEWHEAEDRTPLPFAKSCVHQVIHGNPDYEEVPDLPEAEFIGGCYTRDPAREMGGIWILVFYWEFNDMLSGETYEDRVERLSRLTSICAGLQDDSQPLPSWRAEDNTLTIVIPVWR